MLISIYYMHITSTLLKLPTNYNQFEKAIQKIDLTALIKQKHMTKKEKYTINEREKVYWPNPERNSILCSIRADKDSSHNSHGSPN